MTNDHDASNSAAVSDPLRLLYVEDDRLNAILFTEALRLQPGIEARVAVDAVDALQQAQGWQPELLVLDAQLPDMHGFQLLAALRELPGMVRVPAIMCSADTLPEDVQRAHDAGFDGFWPKPINVAMILAEMQRRLAVRDAVTAAGPAGGSLARR